ncbi:MAG: hypothetical protein M1824_006288 [Vezdaea acicularis]|nr:MAG: hypothetical protein M1824_006288 [Vezdaea acicularis]
MSISYSGDSYGSGYDSQTRSERTNSYTQEMSRTSSNMEDLAGSPLTPYSDAMSPTESVYAVDKGSIQPASDFNTQFYDLIQREDPYPSYYQLKPGYEPNENLPYTVLCNQRVNKDKQFVCLYKGCATHGKFRRAADLDRHYKDTHNPQYLFDCPDKNCNRVGENGFKRQDHLVEHRRTVHVKNIPKKGTREYDQWKKDEKKRRYSSIGL